VPDSLRVKDYAVTAPAPLKGTRVAVIGKLDAGAAFVDDAKLQAIVREANTADPDLVLLAGGYAGGIAPEAIAAHLARLEAPMGVFAVLGADDGEMGRALERAGIFVLRNFHIVIGTRRGPLLLAGLSAGEGRALSGLPDGTTLCLAHDAAALEGLACDLAVAGHGAEAGLRQAGGKPLFIAPAIRRQDWPARLYTRPEIALLRIQ